MPHLSPMNWMFMSMMFWLLLISLMTSFWWNNPAKFKTLNFKSEISNNNLPW